MLGSSQCSPDSLAGLKGLRGPMSKGREEGKGEKKGKGKD